VTDENVEMIPAALKEAVDAAKASGYEVEMATVARKEYAYRPIKRSEWKALLRKRNEGLIKAGTDELLKAEIMEEEFEYLLSTCLVYTPVPVENLPAGVVQTLADAILAMSGFGGLDSAPIRL
jgi:hypothetical protein